MTTYFVLSSFDSNDVTCTKFESYDKALIKFYAQFSANLANHKEALEMLVDNYGNVHKVERYEKEVAGGEVLETQTEPQTEA